MKAFPTLLLLLVITGVAHAQTWDLAFARRGPNGPVNAIAFHGGDVYIGGEFTEVDGVAANNIAVWNGVRWSPLGGGVDARVNAIGVADAGVFVGGEFDTVDGRPLRGLALYSGGEWRTLESGGAMVDGPVDAIAIDGDDVFVGGEFRLTIDSVSEQSIAIWSMRDRSWRGLGGGVRVRGASWGEVLAIATSARYAYVAGLFTYVNVNGTEISSAGVARWDRQALRWDSLGGIVPSDPDALEVARALAIDGTHVYALGDFDAVDGVEADGVARFDESRGAWEDVGLVGLSYSAAVAARSSRVYAANASGLVFPNDALVTWNSSGAWTESGAGIVGSIYALAFAPNGDLYVGGELDSARGTAVRNLIRLTASPLAVDEPADAARVATIRSLRRNVLTLDLANATAADTRITIHDILGRELADITPGALTQGRHALRIDGRLPHVCVVTVRSENLSESRIIAVEP